MKKVLILSAMTLAIMACGNQAKQSFGETDSLADSLFLQPDTLPLDSAVETSRIKHTAEYIHQRVDSIYEPTLKSGGFIRT